MLVNVLNIDDIKKAYSIYHCNTSRILFMNKDNSINYLGLGYIAVLAEKAKLYNYTFICNVSDNAYAAQAAFRMGFKKIYYNGTEIVFNKLYNIARQYETQLFNKQTLHDLFECNS